MAVEAMSVVNMELVGLPVDPLTDWDVVDTAD